MNPAEIFARYPFLRTAYKLLRLPTYKLSAALGFPYSMGRALVDLRRLRAVSPLPPPSEKPRRRVLFVAPRAWSTHAVFQAVTAQALTLRGATCRFAFCGGVMPVCEIERAETEFFPSCRHCSAYLRDLAAYAGIPYSTIGDLVPPDLVKETTAAVDEADLGVLKKFARDDVPVGKYAAAAARWRLRAYDLAGRPEGREVLAAFVRGGILWAAGFEKVLDEFRPDVVVMLNGLFMEERVSWAAARKRGIHCVFFERGRDAETIFLSHDVPAPHYEVGARWAAVKDRPLTPAQREAVHCAMARRARGEKVVETYWKAAESDLREIRNRLRLPPDAVPAVAFPNIVWDTTMLDRETAFSDMFDWLRQTVEIFSGLPEHFLVVRTHPAETQLPGRRSVERADERLRREFNPLPTNVRLVAPDEPLDSYALMSMTRLGLVYASTVGVELAVRGVPVIVGGKAHYAGKGFTYDIAAKEDYPRLAAELLEGRRPLPRDRQIEAAERYAHLFFLRCALKLPGIAEPAYGRPRLTYRSLDELKPGRDKVLDLVCDGILDGREFVLPEDEARSGDGAGGGGGGG